MQRTLTFCNEVKPFLPKKNSTFFILGVGNIIAIVYNVIKIKDKEKPKMTKYVLLTDHRAGFDEEDKIMPLKAQNLFDAILESEKFCINDDNLYGAYLYEKATKNEYRRIMRSGDGMNFHIEGSSDYLVRSTYKVNGKTFESFKICL